MNALKKRVVWWWRKRKGKALYRVRIRNAEGGIDRPARCMPAFHTERDKMLPEFGVVYTQERAEHYAYCLNMTHHNAQMGARDWAYVERVY